MEECASGNRGEDGVRDGLGFVEDVKNRVHVGRDFRVPSFRASGIVGGEPHGKAAFGRADFRLVEGPARKKGIVHIAAQRRKKLLFHLYPGRGCDGDLSPRKTGEKVQDSRRNAVAGLTRSVGSH